jgi:competence ComEA-like helix-hairpin-helix protein
MENPDDQGNPNDQGNGADVIRARSLAVVVFVMIVCMVVIDRYKSQRHVNNQWESEDYVIDLNLATEAELNLLPGVGPKLASDIIRFRQTEGLFTAPEQLQKIRGIKGTRFEALKKHVMVRPEGSKSASE